MVVDDNKIENISTNNDKFAPNFKRFLKNSRKNWLWINVGATISTFFFMWFFYFEGIFDLWITIVISIGLPLGIILRNKIKFVKHPIMMNKIMLIGVVGFLITDVFWLLALYMLFTAPWAPIDQNKIPHWEGYSILAVIFVGIYVMVGYFLYRFGEKREWHISPYY